MSQLENALYTVSQIRQIEKYAINELNIPEFELMQTAGRAAFQCLKKYYPDARRIAVFCGGGNNGGDGFVVATLAKQQGLDATVFHLKDTESLTGTALQAAQLAKQGGVSLQLFDSDLIDIDADVIVDALLGIGLTGEVESPCLDAIELINQQSTPVLAIDCPSGLNVDTGESLGTCVDATHTITFIGLKQGLYTADGLNYCGKIICDSLQLDNLNKAMKPAAELLAQEELNQALPKRKANSHKGLFGHVLLVGGGPGMPGAITMAARACLRVGAGLVSVATHPSHASFIPVSQPEIMSHGIETVEQLSALLEKPSVCVVGPGLGQSEWAWQLFQTAITCQLPTVIDASALSFLALEPQHDDNWILTPHPGEAAIMLGCTTSKVQKNRFKGVSKLQSMYDGVVVLKGAGTLIKAPHQAPAVCQHGNPGMSSGGMGDVLTGIIAGFLAQGLSLVDAARKGVLCHALAGDMAAKDSGEKGLLATDLLSYIRNLVQ